METSVASAALNDDLFERTRLAARAGARLVVWSETAALIPRAGEDAFLKRAAAVAREEGIYLFAAYGSVDASRAHSLGNRLAAATPQGDVAWVYDKAHAIAGAGSAVVESGERRMRVLDTPFGRVAGTICHDADFPRYMRQAAELRVDVLVNSAYDWAAIQRVHANMAAFRAVENGVTMVRAARGISFAVGPLGNALASSNSIAGDGLDVVSLVPVRSLSTVAFGGWITLALATLLAALSALRASMRARAGWFEEPKAVALDQTSHRS